MTVDLQASPERLEVAGGERIEVVRLRDNAAGTEAVVTPAGGGEVCSLRIRRGGEWLEMLHRALDFSPTEEWTGRAPLLFPQVGRCYAPSERPPSPIPEHVACSWEHGGQAFPMPCHGFARDATWALDGYGDDAESAWARCLLRSDERTMSMYPFEFELSATHSLRGGSLVSRYDLAAGGNAGPMPFTIGNHISLRVPLTSVGDYSDVRVSTPCRYEMVLDEDSLLSGRRRELTLSEGATLGDEKLSNIVLGGYEDDAPWVLLEDPAGLSIRVTQRQIAEGFASGDVLFVFWGEERLKYFCPEPWLGAPDALNTHRHLANLGPGETFSWEMAVTPSAF